VERRPGLAVLIPFARTARGASRPDGAALRGVRVAVHASVRSWVALLLGCAWALPARAAEAVPLDEALARAFPRAHFEKRTLALSPNDVKAVEARARTRCEPRLVTALIAWRGDTLAGAAWIDRRVVRTREAVLLLSVTPDTSLARIDVLAFFEPPEYLPPARWLGLFRGRGGRAPLTPRRPVPNLAGATLTSRAVNESARLALAWYEVLLAPRLASRPNEITPKPQGSSPR
jgi:hypothetical protein